MALIDLKQAEQNTGLSARQLHWMIRRRRIKACQPGGPRGKWYLHEDDLETLMQPVQPTEEQK